MNLIKNYFFIPAVNQKFLEKSLYLENIDFRVLDFEDSILISDINSAIQNVKGNKLFKTDWARIPINRQFQKTANSLFELGLHNLIIPKYKNKEHFDYIMNQLVEMNNDVRVIVLVESALAYFHLEDILKKWAGYINGISLGSHDFSTSTNIRHNSKELYNLRLQISLLASAYGVTQIDIASMNISDTKEFNDEIQCGHNLGYRAKFLLHPFQLSLLSQYPFYTKDEVENAMQVLELFSKNKANAVIKHKGNIYEKPHIKNLQNIKKWGIQYYGTNR